MTIRLIHPAAAHGHLRAPPSKSYTHRALVAAFLSNRECEVVGPLDSDDTRATRNGLRVLGARVWNSASGWKVAPSPHGVRRVRRTVRCGESGTTLRFLSAVAARGGDPVSFEGAAGLSVRPMGELFGALRQLGAVIRCPVRGRSLPCTIRGPLRAGTVTVRADVSSQFVSALLMVLPTAVGPSRLRLRGPSVSKPYVEATRAVLKDRRVRIDVARDGFLIPGDQRYRAGRILVPGDASSAAYLWAAAAVTGGRVEIEGVPADLPQADLAILPIFTKMGAGVYRGARSVRVTGPVTEPISVNLTNSPDLFPLVSVLAAGVPGGRSQLKGAPHLKFKESNRRAQSVRLVRAMGAGVSEYPSRVEIIGTDSPRALNLPSLADHRLVMSAAVAALIGSGTSRIGRAETVSKSFPGFWNALAALTKGG